MTWSFHWTWSLNPFPFTAVDDGLVGVPINDGFREGWFIDIVGLFRTGHSKRRISVNSKNYWNVKILLEGLKNVKIVSWKLDTDSISRSGKLELAKLHFTRETEKYS